MYRDIEALRTTLYKYGLAPFEAEILALAVPTVRMRRTSATNDDIAVGDSKMGGHPDLPPGFVWPQWDEKPLTFIVQFRLSDVAHARLPTNPLSMPQQEKLPFADKIAEAPPYGDRYPLPRQGMLYFFYEADTVPMGEYADRDGWSVVYLPDEDADLKRTAHPTHAGEWRTIQALPVHRLAFERGLTLPIIGFNEQDEYVFRPADHGEDVHERYWDLAATGESPQHYLLGHPLPIQGPIEREVARYSQHIEFPINDKTRAKIEADAQQWQFLFQIDSDDSLEVMWGDAGMLYVCIPKDSLEKCQFQDCWTIMQCS